ncbi:MAG: DegV family protein [Clostridiales bacterium]|nr:DegV family protein [Clostridiales bacterium]
MHAIGIATDSHASLPPDVAKQLNIRILPMPFTIDGQDYLEGVDLTREEFFARQAAGADIATSQPSPSTVMALWDEMLLTHEQILYMPISSGLSGSCSTATALAQDEPYLGRVFVVDNGRVASPLYQSILDARYLEEKGLTAPQIKAALESVRDQVSIYIAVETLTYLQKGGRISSAAAAVGTLLNIKPILKLATGKLESHKKARGFRKAQELMLEAIREDLAIRFREQHARGDVFLIAAGSADEAATAAWFEQITAAFPGMPLLYADLSMGVSCHTGPGALAVGLSIRPRI